MIWELSDAQDYRIATWDGWFNLNSVQENAPKRAGVYVFVNSAFQVKYIGKAGAGRLQAEIQNALCREKGNGASRFAWFATNSDANALSLENDWIHKYQPPNNDKK